MDVLHRDSRTIFISGEITDGMIEVRQAIHELRHESGAHPIHLVINSSGGSVVGAMAVVDALDHARSNSDLNVTGVVEGVAESAALTILQGCDRRVAGRFSLLMAHGTTGSITNMSMQELHAYERYRTILHEYAARLYAKRTPQRNFSDWMRLFESDVEDYYTPPEALKLGLIDAIAGI